MFKNCTEFQDSKKRALNRAWGPSKSWVLSACLGHLPMKQALCSPDR